MAQGNKVQAVEKAMVLLDCLRRAEDSLSLTELAEQTGWAKSTIHGLLAPMVDWAVVEQDPADARYRLGDYLFKLGQSVSARWEETALLRPELSQLARKLGTPVTLFRQSGDFALAVAWGTPGGGSAALESRIPLYCTAPGKCILSAMPEAEARALLERRGMPAVTPATLTAWEALQIQLSLIRELGYCVERGEYRKGHQGIAVPVFSRDGICRYVLGITQPMLPGAPGTDKETVSALRRLAERIGAEQETV